MSYISGTTSQDAKIIVLDSDNNVLAAAEKTAGAYKIDKFGDTLTGATESGTVVAVSTTGETLSYNKVQFAQEYDLSNVPYTETFTGTWPANWHMWTRTHGTNVAFNNGKLRETVSAGSAGRSSCISDFLIWGNFDIQVDLDVISGPSTGDWVSQMQIRYEPCVSVISGNSLTALCDFFAVRRYYTSGAHRASVTYRIAGTNTNPAPVSTTITSTKFRIVRNNNLITGYYWTGSAWTALASNINFDSAYTGGHAPISVRLETSNDVSFPAATMDFDNFTINSGYITYRHIESFVGYTNGNPPDTNFFDSTSGLVTTQSEKLRLATSASVSNSSTKYKYPLKGNFDVVCSFNMVAAPSSGIWHAQFKVQAPDAGNAANIKRTYNGSTHYIAATSYIDGSSATDSTTTAASGYYRLRRNATTLYIYYSTDSATWTQLHTRSNWPIEDAYIYFNVFYTSGTPAVTCDFGDLKIINKPFNNLKVKFPIDSNR